MENEIQRTFPQSTHINLYKNTVYHRPNGGWCLSIFHIAIETNYLVDANAIARRASVTHIDNNKCVCASKHASWIVISIKLISILISLPSLTHTLSVWIAIIGENRMRNAFVRYSNFFFFSPNCVIEIPASIKTKENSNWRREWKLEAKIKMLQREMISSSYISYSYIRIDMLIAFNDVSVIDMSIRVCNVCDRVLNVNWIVIESWYSTDYFSFISYCFLLLLLFVIHDLFACCFALHLSCKNAERFMKCTLCYLIRHRLVNLQSHWAILSTSSSSSTAFYYCFFFSLFDGLRLDCVPLLIKIGIITKKGKFK